MSFTPSGFFALRTPLLPFDVLTRSGEALRAPRAAAGDLDVALNDDRNALVTALRAAVSDPIIREALFVASPTLDEAVTTWLANPQDPRTLGLEAILIRYLTRMSARPTPFGLFAGCSVGEISTTTKLRLVGRAEYRRHTRLDMHYLSALCDALVKDPEHRAKLRFRPSTALYEAGGRLRYAEANVDAKTRELGFQLMSLERDEALVSTLTRAERGALPGELAEALVDADVTREDADAYIDDLIASQILTSELAPPITGEEPIRGILTTLEDGAAKAALADAQGALRSLDDDGLGQPAIRYHAVAERLAALPAKPELAKLFQVDLYKPGGELRLGHSVLRELTRGIELVARITPRPSNDVLEKFRRALGERYGGRLDGPLSDQSTVPLLEVLDEEAGIGFGAIEREPTPLLEGLVFPGSAAVATEWGGREAHLFRRLNEHTRAGTRNWVLDDEDVEKLGGDRLPTLPDAFAVDATLTAPSDEALERGDFRLFLRSIGGPSGATLLGRFSHGDATLRRAVEAHLRAEEALRPDAIFAEIVHLPEGRHGNVICRPALRDYEIAYLGRSGVAEDHRITISDLRIGLRDNRILLWSSRLQREVVPRLASAHAYHFAALGLYRFLGALQTEGLTNGAAWSWGALASAPFLPRVSYRKVVLALARWSLAKDQLEPLGKTDATERYRAVQRLRHTLGLPRWISLNDGDNVLPVDLDNVLHVDSFVQLVKGRAGASVAELVADEGLVVHGPEGRFVHELIIPFTSTRTPTGAALPAPLASTSVARRFPPGSEWLYAKIYTGTAGVDIALRDVVAPFIENARADGALKRWFFIRFGDPDWHLRVRLHGSKERLVAECLPKLTAALEPLLADGRVWRVQLDTYEREVGRYGGPEGVELCESIFEADSDATLEIIERLDPSVAADERWRLTLRGMHGLLLDLGLDLEQRLAILRRVRSAFASEHRVDVHAEKELGAKFRAERANIAALLTLPADADHPLAPGFQVLARRSERVTPLAHELRSRQLTSSIEEIAPALLHMHANRLLRGEHRAQELVLYDFLLRSYESERARSRRT